MRQARPGQARRASFGRGFQLAGLAAGGLLVGLLATGCRRAPEGPLMGQKVRCNCTYLTDYDDTATVGVEVCVPRGGKVDEEARQCALQSAHNHIDRCECGPLAGDCDARAKDACSNH